MLLKNAAEAFTVLCFSKSIWDTYGTFLMNVEVTLMLVKGVHCSFMSMKDTIVSYAHGGSGHCLWGESYVHCAGCSASYVVENSSVRWYIRWCELQARWILRWCEL
jgi:hypothetical protein